MPLVSISNPKYLNMQCNICEVSTRFFLSHCLHGNTHSFQEEIKRTVEVIMMAWTVYYQLYCSNIYIHMQYKFGLGADNWGGCDYASGAENIFWYFCNYLLCSLEADFPNLLTFCICLENLNCYLI